MSSANNAFSPRTTTTLEYTVAPYMIYNVATTSDKMFATVALNISAGSL